MKLQTKNTELTFKTITFIYILIFTIIFPAQITAKPVPANSVFNQNTNVQEQNDESKIDKSFGNIPVYFEQNNGQFDKRVKYFARGTNGYSLFLTATDAVYVLSDSSEFRVQSSELKDKSQTLNTKPETLNSKATAIYMKLVGGNEQSESVGLQEMSHKTNYFKGKESDWRTDIPNFEEVRIVNVYEGIDLIWNGDENGLVQSDFLIGQNAEIEQIEWEIEGAESFEIDNDGDLLVKTEFGTFKQGKPSVYLESDNFNQEMSGNFEIKNNNKIGLRIGNEVSIKKELNQPSLGTNSPLSYSTFIGGASDDDIFTSDVSNNGEVFVAGQTRSFSFPITPGTIDTGYTGNTDGFVSKLNATGTALIYSTYLGSEGLDVIRSIKLDRATGKLYVVGTTDFTNGVLFPTTTGAFDTTHNGQFDAFITVLNADGNSLSYSTYLGGGFADNAYGVDFDNSGNVFVTGTSNIGAINPNPFPTTGGAYNPNHNGLTDCFVTKLNINTSNLVFSTFLGGSLDDVAIALAVDNIGNVFITGRTNSDGLFGGFPTTTGSFDQTFNGVSDVFVTKLNPGGTGLVFSTLIGGNDIDQAFDLTIDPAGNSYIVGNTFSNTVQYPTTPGAFDSTFSGQNEAFLTKLNATGNALVFSTLLGGSESDEINAVKIDGSGHILLGGYTNSFDFPVTLDAFDFDVNGQEAFFTKFKPDGSVPTYSTFIGGGGLDRIYSIAIDNLGKTYLSGFTSVNVSNPTNYPTTTGAFDTSHNGGTDGFITKFQIPSNNTSNAPFDFDGDSKTDISIFRQSVGEWWYLRSSDGGNGALQFGNSSDIITPGDFTGDGKADFAFFRPSNGNWFILRSEDSSFFAFPFGANGDIPAPGDYDGDGKTDAAVFRPSIATWFVLNSGGSGTSIVGFGLNGDKPVVADYDGDGKDDIGIYRPSNSQWWINQSSDGVTAIQFGSAGDQTVQGDYTGDGKADFAFFRPSNGNWFIVRSEDSSFFSFPFGANGDIPVPGDYDGDGKYDSAVFRPTNNTWYLNQTTAGVGIVGFGSTGDKPVPSAYVYQ